MEYLEDSSGTLSIADVRASHQFVQSKKLIPSFGFSKSVYWFHCRFIANPVATDLRWLLELGYSHFRTADLYVFNQAGQQIGQILAGNSRGEAHRPLATHNYVFPLRLAAGQEVHLYLRCDGMASKLFPLTLYEQDAFYNAAQTTSLWLGFYFGFLAITILYHLLLFFYNQTKSYLLFSAYLSAYLLNELLRGNGNYIERLVLVYHPFWQEHVVSLLNGVIVLVSVLGLRFYSMGLKLETAGWMYKLLRWMQAINLLIYSLLLTGMFPVSYSLFFNFTVPLFAYLTVLLISLVRIVEGYRPAWYYFLATLILFAGVLIVMCERSGWLEGTNFWQHNAIQVASIIEILLLSLGFAEGIRAERKRRKMELEVSNLAGRKSEREWLSIVLHTSFGTTLSTMLFGLSQLEWKRLTETNLNLLVNLKKQLDNSLDELRILARSLPPTLLDEQGLPVALKTLITNYNTRNQVQFHFNTDGNERRLEARQEFELYLIGLELVNNVMRHAEATSAWLDLIWGQHDDSLTIRMRDNGKGFADNSSGGGYGLESIRRIVQHNLDGSVEATNGPAGGALVTVRVQLPQLAKLNRVKARYSPVRQLFGVVRSYF
ncbi:sensor histidine kinase [Fibrella forsythiae]|uniref:histidine kinase n=1 Tax=Fibrella forsythiae TaxID=2817061 RepID=A0ABS3JI02_9BACT|nr:7TM-DISM domain-containing protein [Fibrella forsythiae]MBO0949635.1 hypothetical protein [Fibrella forsythiae]